MITTSLPGRSTVARQLEESIQRYLEALETADRTQPVEAQSKTSRLGEKTTRLRERVKELARLKEQLQGQHDPQISGSRSMTRDGCATGIVGYNVQAAVHTT